MERLRTLLGGMQPGRIQDTSDLEIALAECWDEFQGDTGGMEAYKLHGRMEKVDWQPPLLTFQIERHGGAVMGSSRAEVQSWSLDVARTVRSGTTTAHRQLRPIQPPLDVKPLPR